MTKYWIQRTIKHKNSLKKWAKEHGFIKNDKIDLNKAYEYAKKHNLTHRIKQINLAKTLKKLRKKKR